MRYNNFNGTLKQGGLGMNTDMLWNNFLNKIKERISPLSYDTWFKDTKLYKIEKI